MIGTSHLAPVQVNLSTPDGFFDIAQITLLTRSPEHDILNNKYFMHEILLIQVLLCQVIEVII